MPRVVPSEFVITLRKKLDLSRDGFATLLDVSSETVRSWEEGRRRCRGPVAILVYLLIQKKLSVKTIVGLSE